MPTCVRGPARSGVPVPNARVRPSPGGWRRPSCSRLRSPTRMFPSPTGRLSHRPPHAALRAPPAPCRTDWRVSRTPPQLHKRAPCRTDWRVSPTPRSSGSAPSATGRRCGDGLPTGPCSSGRRPCPRESEARLAPRLPCGESLGPRRKFRKARTRVPATSPASRSGARKGNDDLRSGASPVGRARSERPCPAKPGWLETTVLQPPAIANTYVPISHRPHLPQAAPWVPRPHPVPLRSGPV